MSLTKEDIDRLVLDKSRELVVAREQHIAREVLKEEKNKRTNYSSRWSEDQENFTSSKVSLETCSKISSEISSHLDISTSLPLGKESEESVSQEEGVSVITPAITSSRDEEIVSGISAQHNRGERGCKLSITVQLASDPDGAGVTLTAELKRIDRLREIKSYSYDSPEFDEYIIETKRDLSNTDEIPVNQRHRWAFGRLHNRGERSAWYPDASVVAKFDTAGVVIENIVLSVCGSAFQITMDHPMSPKQEKLYHSAGFHGKLRQNKQVYDIYSAPRTAI